MKKIIFIASLVGLFVASRAKSHTCTCTTIGQGAGTQVITIDGTSSNAKKTCEGYSINAIAEDDSTSTTCVLE